VIGRIALLVAPSDPLADSAAARREALGWLRGQLARRGFQVAIVGGGADARGDLDQALAKVSPGDAVVVHVSGRLAASDSIASGRGDHLRLGDLGDLLAAREPGYVSVVLDLLSDDGSGEPGEDDPDLPSKVAASIFASERGYPVLVSLRAAVDSAGRMGFTRHALPEAYDGGPPSGEALLAEMYERAMAAEPNGVTPARLAFLRGTADPTIDGLVAWATKAGHWARVVELRVDRADQLAGVGQRVQELCGIARILQFELGDADAAIDVLLRARTLDPARATVLEALKHAYEAAGRAPPIEPADVAKAFAAHQRARQTDAALLDAMVLVELSAAQPEHRKLVEESRAVGPVPILKALDASGWEMLYGPGFDPALSALFASVHDAAVSARVDAMPSGKRPPALDSAVRLDDESTVSAVRTLHWAARVLGVACPDLYAAAADAALDVLTQVPGKRDSIILGAGALSGTSSKQLAFLAGRCLTWHRREYHCLLYYPSREDLYALVTAALAVAGSSDLADAPVGSAAADLRREIARRIGAQERAVLGEAAARLAAPPDPSALDPWIRSAELTAARAGLFLCGDLATAVAALPLQPAAPGRPSIERVKGDLLAFCASPSHVALRAHFLSATR